MSDIKTFQDYEKAEDKLGFIREAITDYKASSGYLRALTAQAYLEGKNTAIKAYHKPVITKTGKQLVPASGVIMSRIFYKLVLQKSQYSLVNGLFLQDQALKARLGVGFDTKLLRTGENAITHGVSYVFWDVDHIVNFSALEFFPLCDERSGAIMAGIRFWSLPGKPLNAELYEVDGVTELQVKDDKVTVLTPKRPYATPNAAQVAAGRRVETVKYGRLPIFAMWANAEKQSDFTEDLQANIDRYDRIFTDFGGNLDRTNDIYWVISNFGGQVEEIKEMLAEIQELKATYAKDDGSGTATATPHTIEVPHEARRVALELLEKQIYSNFCGLNISSLAGGNKTATEIKLSIWDLNNIAVRFEVCVFDFCQQLIEFVTGEKTENIKLKRQNISNEQEENSAVLAAAPYLDHQTLLEKLTFIEQDEVEIIMQRKAAEDAAQQRLNA